jgi:hypothetical protein
MTWDRDVSDLIARYLHAVSEGLPRPLRDDVTRELRSLIEDKLEDRAQTLAQPIDAALAAYVLHEIGRPADVARRYDLAPQYLVGPRFYPAFMRILKIGLAGLAVMLLFSTLVGQVLSPQGPHSVFTLATLGRLLALYFQTGISLFGQAVIVLAILERTKLGERVPSAQNWDVRDLPELPDAREEPMSIAGTAVGACLTVLVAVWLNFFPRWVAVFMVMDDQSVVVPLSDFGIQLPMLVINVWLALALTLKLVMIAQRRWTQTTRWAQVGLGFLAAIVLFDIVAHSMLSTPSAMPAFAHLLLPLSLLFYAMPLVALISPLKRIVRLLRPRPATATASA